jgi:HAD superfamily hydrolase (TIGR01549 family)
MLGWSNDQLEIIKWGNRKEEIYRELGLKDGIPLITRSKNFITELHNHAIPLVIGTSTERKNIELAIEQNKLAGMFVGAVCSEDVSRGKPDPEVFLKAAQLINKDPQVCVVFEDSTHGIEAAVNAGMVPVGITTTNPKKALMDKGAELVVNHLDEIDLSILEDLIKSRS